MYMYCAVHVHAPSFLYTVNRPMYIHVYTCTGLILNGGNGGNGGNCLHCPWSLPWCPFKSPNRNLQIPHRGAKEKSPCPFKYEVSGLHAYTCTPVCTWHVHTYIHVHVPLYSRFLKYSKVWLTRSMSTILSQLGYNFILIETLFSQ